MNKSRLIFDLLDLERKIPLTEKSMAENLKVTFQPIHKSTKRLDKFAENL